MLLPILNYGHPTLRQKGRPVETFTPEIERLAADMVETMVASHGVGLAAQQVGHALQLMVLDIREVEDRPSTLQWGGQSVDPAAHMPLVLINARLKPIPPERSGPEGCLSFPGLYADVSRPESVEVTALNQHGEPIQFQAGGLLARAIQHEFDHLQGILFIDRMGRETREELKEQLDELQSRTKHDLKRGGPAPEWAGSTLIKSVSH